MNPYDLTHHSAVLAVEYQRFYSSSAAQKEINDGRRELRLRPLAVSGSHPHPADYQVVCDVFSGKLRLGPDLDDGNREPT